MQASRANSVNSWYAVCRGHNTGVFLGWYGFGCCSHFRAACEREVNGYSRAFYKRFDDQAAALSFYNSFFAAQPDYKRPPSEDEKLVVLSFHVATAGTKAGAGLVMSYPAFNQQEVVFNDEQTVHSATLWAAYYILDFAVQIIVGVYLHDEYPYQFPCTLQVNTSSVYFLDGLDNWYHKWRKEGWVNNKGKLVRNYSVWQKFLRAYNTALQYGMRVFFNKVDSSEQGYSYPLAVSLAQVSLDRHKRAT